MDKEWDYSKFFVFASENVNVNEKVSHTLMNF